MRLLNWLRDLGFGADPRDQVALLGRLRRLRSRYDFHCLCQQMG